MPEVWAHPRQQQGTYQDENAHIFRVLKEGKRFLSILCSVLHQVGFLRYQCPARRTLQTIHLQRHRTSKKRRSWRNLPSSRRHLSLRQTNGDPLSQTSRNWAGLMDPYFAICRTSEYKSHLKTVHVSMPHNIFSGTMRLLREPTPVLPPLRICN